MASVTIHRDVFGKNRRTCTTSLTVKAFNILSCAGFGTVAPMNGVAIIEAGRDPG